MKVFFCYAPSPFCVILKGDGGKGGKKKRKVCWFSHENERTAAAAVDRVEIKAKPES